MSSYFELRKNIALAILLGSQDIKGRYRRSVIGPFWLTISMSILISCIGIIFGQMFQTPDNTYIVFLSAGIIFWNFFTGVLNEGCIAFINSEKIIRQLPIPLFVHIFRLIWRNLLVLIHNILIFPMILVFSDIDIGLEAFLALLGLLLVSINLAWTSMLLALICTRYRDLPQVIASLLQVSFYLTPIIWLPSMLSERLGQSLYFFNPFFHFLEIIRSPLMGQTPDPSSWVFSAATGFLGCLFTFLIFKRLHGRVVYWL